MPTMSNNGAPAGIRTPDTRLRRPLLYPTELQAHIPSPRKSTLVLAIYFQLTFKDCIILRYESQLFFASISWGNSPLRYLPMLLKKPTLENPISKALLCCTGLFYNALQITFSPAGLISQHQPRLHARLIITNPT